MNAFTRRDEKARMVIVEHNGVFYGISENVMQKLPESLQKAWRNSVEEIALGLDPVWKPV